MQHKTKFHYKGSSVNILGLPTFNKPKKSDNTQKRKYLYSFNFSFPKNKPKDLLLIYDIPEGRKKERDWFRRQLKNLDFFMIQRSVWVGPSPLPSDFIFYLKRIGLYKEFKIFKLAKPYKL